jgi:uncharacterized RDD family membrane protein YckC
MTVTPARSGEARGKTLRYLLRRGGAYVLDVAGLAALVQAAQWAWARAAGGGLPRPVSGLQIEAWVLLSVSLPIWLYFIVMERSGWQATVGKRALGLRVARTGGGRISLNQAVVRTALKLLPWELTHATLLLPAPMWNDPDAGLRPGLVIVYALLGLYAASAALTPRRQTLPDLAAGTVVIETKEIAQ